MRCWKRRAEADSNRGPSAYQPNTLPLSQTCSPLGTPVSSSQLQIISPALAGWRWPSFGQCSVQASKVASWLHQWRDTPDLLLLLLEGPRSNCWSFWCHTPSIAFWHLPPNSARFGYATEGACTLYFRAAVLRRGQRPPKGSGTNMTVEAT